MLSFSAALIAQAAHPTLVPTDFGDLRERTIRGICHATTAFVGVVESSSSKQRVWEQGKLTRRSISTDIRFRVERTLTGEPSTHQEVTIPGGTVGEWTMRTASDDQLPRPVKGRRYLIGTRAIVDGGTVISAVVPMDADLELPTVDAFSQVTRSFKAQYCQSPTAH